MARTRGEHAHTDVSLWYLLDADARTITSYDQGEFNAIRWLTDEQVPPELVPIARYYGTVVRSCVPAYPASKGGTEATVRIAKRDLVPAAVNLRPEYADFAELQEACEDFMSEVNGRGHCEIRRIPAELLAEERLRLHPVPEQPFTAAFGETRRVGKDPTISVESVRYSVPHEFVDECVWVRFHGDELIVTAMAAGSAVEAARHPRSVPGSPRIADEHYLDAPCGQRTPRATNPAEAQFLAIGPGAAAWLVEAAATGVRRIRAKMGDAVALAKPHGTADVDRALGTAATVGRFAERDLLSILEHQGEHDRTDPIRRGEAHSLQPGTSAWSGFTTP
ncbi:hypothetical protein BEK98_37145 [Streptomyces diastatochromogenes]|uniref:Transposase for insertion sequence element IS21-like C-terminal domain-containing protein n=1 Tax=Streptomyces diastatochromogenes TaxID=42236 RepID=A0A233S1W9_STRDA|nr:hypothetical protein [Streptomyces diastatochromogenes]MCZ0991577.1 hypothetical protein [Streptomyces diastatochromogenes]OXY89646.1 hypothetical protein BEK98_37145 [Streptomyces diastatochromogenes]